MPAERFERWPPSYDAAELAAQIRSLSGSDSVAKRFYADLTAGGEICQGDVVRLTAPLPYLDSEGRPAVDTEYSHWLVIGNTCDFVRDDRDVPWSQIVPLVMVPAGDIGRDELAKLSSYSQARRFYVPPWPGGDTDHRIADLCQPVTTAKACLRSIARVEARLDLPAWVLLHCCLVRFLARDDGGFDPT